MTKYNTGNPVGSADPRDRHDNTKNFDELLLSKDKVSVPDRLGVPRKSWHGMESEFNADQSDRTSRFDTDQVAREQQYQQVILEYGNVPLGDYAADIRVTSYNQTIRDCSGGTCVFYRAAVGTDLPYDTTGLGMPEGGAFVDVGDAVLRADLASSAGASLVATKYAGANVNDVFSSTDRADATLQAIAGKVGGGGFNFVILGDSTECGVGGLGGPYGETTEEFRNSNLNRIGYLMATNDPDFTGPDPNSFTYNNANANGFSIGKAYPHYELNVSDSPGVEFKLNGRARNQRNSVTIYLAEQTSNSAATALVEVINAAGTTIASQVIDSYTHPIAFGSIPALDVKPKFSKRTIPLTSGERLVRVRISGLALADRGEGIAEDGSLYVYGATLGDGVGVYNLSVSGTTLTEGSSFNVSRGVDTSERVSKLKTLDADVVYIGWGANDSKVGITTLTKFSSEYDSLLVDLKTWKPHISIIAGTDPRGKGSVFEDNVRYNEAVRHVAKKHGIPVFDVEALSDEMGARFYADQIHPSSFGYQAMTNALASKLNLKAHHFDVSSRYGLRVLSYDLVTSNHFSGSFESTIVKQVTVPSWAMGYVITCNLNCVNASGALDKAAAKLIVSGITVDEKTISSAVVSAVGLGLIALNDTRLFTIPHKTFEVEVQVRDLSIRFADSKSKLQILFI